MKQTTLSLFAAFKLSVLTLFSSVALAGPYYLDLKLGTAGTINSKSVLDAASTTKGALIPRMTTAQRTSISTPPEGLFVYDTDLDQFWGYTGSAWAAFGSGLGSTSAPAASAVAELSSTSKGILIPRMTSAQLAAISSPAEGLLVWDTDLNQLWNYTGSAWSAIGSALGGVSAPDSKAVLELSSTTKGFLGPRMTTTQRDNIATPPQGLEIFNTDTLKKNVYTGTAWAVVGSGSGGGGSGGGINFVGMDSTFTTASQDDVDAEAAVGNWALFDDGAVTSPVDMTAGSTATITLSRTTTGGEILNGTASFKIVKTAANSQGEGFSVSMYVPVGYRGQNAQVTIPFKVISGTLAATNLRVFAYDQTNGSVFFSSSSYVTGTSIVIDNMVMPSSAAQVRLGFMFTSTDATAATVTFDDVNLGPPKNLGTISQATLYGTAFTPATVNCFWQRNNVAMGAFAATAACPAPTVTGNAEAPATKVPGVKFTNLPPGEYLFVFTGEFYQGSAVNIARFQCHDGTSYSNETLPVYDNAAYQNTVTCSFSYTTAGTRTIELHGQTNGAVNIVIDAQDTDGFHVKVYRFPTTSETAFRSDQLANSWMGIHEDDCSFGRTDTALGNPAADASCTFTEKINNNFGTVTSYLSGSDKLPGIVFTPSRIGTYWVCASFGIEHNTTADSMDVRLWDGTTTIVNQGMETTTTSAENRKRHTYCGMYKATSTAEKTLSLQTAAGSGAITIFPGGASADAEHSAILWNIFQIDQSFPMVKLDPGQAELILETGNGFGSSATARRRWTTTTKNTGADYWTYADSASAGGTITIKRAGTYCAITQEIAASGTPTFGIVRNPPNGTDRCFNLTAEECLVNGCTNTSAAGMSATWCGPLLPNDVLAVQADTTLQDTATYSRFRLYRTGP